MYYSTVDHRTALRAVAIGTVGGSRASFEHDADEVAGDQGPCVVAHFLWVVCASRWFCTCFFVVVVVLPLYGLVFGVCHLGLIYFSRQFFFLRGWGEKREGGGGAGTETGIQNFYQKKNVSVVINPWGRNGEKEALCGGQQQIRRVRWGDLKQGVVDGTGRLMRISRAREGEDEAKHCAHHALKKKITIS